jgi:hypothetical protein
VAGGVTRVSNPPPGPRTARRATRLDLH